MLLIFWFCTATYEPVKQNQQILELGLSVNYTFELRLIALRPEVTCDNHMLNSKKTMFHYYLHKAEKLLS